MPLNRTLPLALVIAAIVATSSRADDAFDDEFTPGLLAAYTSGGVTVERIETSPAVEWSDGTIDERLPVGPTRLEWRAQLLIRAEEPYQLHAHFAGDIEILVDGQSVLHHSRVDVGWASTEPLPLAFGFRELIIRYSSVGDTGRCAIFWSGDSFPLEPLPHHQLFLPEARPDLARYERGRDLFETHRCGRCHRGAGEITDPEAPPLFHVSTGIAIGWFEEKLRGHAAGSDEPHPSAPRGRMPHFDLNEEEVDALSTWLWYMSQPTNTVPVPDTQPDRDEVPSGEVLFHSVGCLACHQFNGLGEAGAWDGGDLTHIGLKRSAEYLATWLQQPTRLNPQASMPVIQLTPTERGRIVEYLVSSVDASNTQFEGQDLRPLPARAVVDRGRELTQALRCVNCHNIPAQQPEWEGIPTLRDGPVDWSRGCLTPLVVNRDEAPPARRRPDFSRHFGADDQQALEAYVESLPGEPAPLASFEQGRRLLANRNCSSCHDRDGSRGVSASAGRISQRVEGLNGRSQDLVPPNLTAIGDKLPDEVFDRALSGRMEDRRLPWLSVRMPRFEHSEQELAALRSFLIARDRIPTDAPRTLQLAAIESSAEEIALLGRSIIGAGGWSCIACHQVGDYVPKNVALGTRGGDLVGISQRMRPEFFLRWCRSPLRIVPGMEMPSYQRPIAGILDDDLDLQMATLWEALKNPSFEAPTNPASVEQLLTVVMPWESPLVVRDVFTVAEENGGGYVPRSFAVGFNNGHSLLYDLDELAVRGWTWGDFARQRAEGKSWFWDLAGTPMATGFVDACEIGLVHGETGEVVLPRLVNGRRGRLIDYVKELGPVLIREDYVTRDNFVIVRHELVFDFPDEVRTVEMTQRFRPWTTFDDPSLHGIQRTVWLRNLPTDWNPQWQTPPPEPQLGSVTSPDRREWVIEGDESMAYSDLIYQAQLTTPRLMPPEVEPILVSGDAVQSLPGYVGQRLPLPVTLMPTAMTRWNDALVIASLKGHIYLAHDSDGDGVEETISVFEEGLSAPFGVLADGDSLLVTHKAELLRLTDVYRDGGCDRIEVVADGWGFTHDYHDWVTGPVRDTDGRLYLATSSDYAQDSRDPAFGQWRGEILQLGPGGDIESIATGLRYPVGIAFDSEGRLFVTDQQGVQNTFNELDLIIPGAHYGVPAHDDPQRDDPVTGASVHIPHPWTRSVNGLFFVPTDGVWSDHPFAGHAVGCEYNMNFLVRMSLQEVDGQLQGACYEFSRANWSDTATGLLGPICGMTTDSGEIYIGTLQDSGWLGGLNQGQIIRFTPSTESATNGIREIRATADGFEIEFLSAVEASTATNPASYSVSGYTRVWEGTYGTEDSGRYAAAIEAVSLSDDGRTVNITCGPLKMGFVYDVSSTGVSDTDGKAIFPNVGYYTMNRIPSE
jgi:mono/diheme cytochrome c family protein